MNQFTPNLGSLLVTATLRGKEVPLRFGPIALESSLQNPVLLQHLVYTYVDVYMYIYIYMYIYTYTYWYTKWKMCSTVKVHTMT